MTFSNSKSASKPVEHWSIEELSALRMRDFIASSFLWSSSIILPFRN